MVRIVQELLLRGADSKAMDSEGDIPLDYIKYYDNLFGDQVAFKEEIVKLLTQAETNSACCSFLNLSKRYGKNTRNRCLFFWYHFLMISSFIVINFPVKIDQFLNRTPLES